MKFKKFLAFSIFAVLTLLQQNLRSEIVHTVTELDNSNSLKLGIEYYEDTNAAYSAEEVYKKTFFLSKSRSLNFGISKSVYWLKFSVKNATNENRLLMKVAYPLLDSIDVFFMHDGVAVLHKQNGLKYQLRQSEITYPVYFFYLPIPQSTKAEILIRVRNHGSFQLPLEIGTESYFIQSGGEISLMQGIYYGILVVMILYNLFIFFSLKEIVYVYYSVCIFFSLSFFFIFYGHARYILWPSNVWMNVYTTKVVMALLSASSAAFAIVFLELKSSAKWLFYILRGIIIAGVVLAISCFFIDLHLIVKLVTFLIMTNAVMMLVAGIVSWLNGYRAARLFVLAWSSYLAGAVLLILRNIGVLPANLITSHFANFGSAMEVVLLSLALADKYRIIRADKDKAKEALIEIQKDANITLEKKVRERTLQLENETQKTESLLLNILPAPVANELKNTGKYMAKRHDNVTVMFTDFVNFTHISEQMIPELLVFELDTYFKKFDEIITRNQIEKIKTIGDAYLCAAGLHDDSGHALKICKAAIEIVDYMEGVNKAKGVGEFKFELRVGVHSGNLVAGVVGSKKFAYDIWGDTVNIAARMEQHGEKGKINISHNTYELIKNNFEVIPRGLLPAKNLGEVEMFFLKH